MDIGSEDSKKELKEGSNIMRDIAFWFSGHDEYDEICKTFVPVIRKAASASGSDSMWANERSVEVKVAKMLLFDQLARNCFRRQSEAFAYDCHGFRVAKELGELFVRNESSTPDDFYSGAYCCFIIVCLTHSEDIGMHRLAFKVLEKIMAAGTAPSMNWRFQHGKSVEHMAVIEKFGRYPHRNEAMGRDTTDEEKEWLSSSDVPMWAKSQMKTDDK